MKHFAKKRTLIRAVQWRGEMTPEMRDLIRERAPNVEHADPLNLGNGWEARSGDWIYSTSGEDLAVISDEVFRKIYEEVDETGHTVALPAPEAASSRARDIYRWMEPLKDPSKLWFDAVLPKGAEFRTAQLFYMQSSIVAGLAKVPLHQIYNLIFSYDLTIAGDWKNGSSPDQRSSEKRRFHLQPGGIAQDLPGDAIYLWTVFEPPLREGDQPNPIMIYETTPAPGGSR